MSKVEFKSPHRKPQDIVITLNPQEAAFLTILLAQVGASEHLIQNIISDLTVELSDACGRVDEYKGNGSGDWTYDKAIHVRDLATSDRFKRTVRGFTKY